MTATPTPSPRSLSAAQAQRLSHIAEDVRDHLRDLTDHYRDFVRVVKAENSHLKLNGPFELEELIRQKTAIGQSLELAVTELYHCRQKLRAFRQDQGTGAADQDKFTLSALCDQLDYAAAGHADMADILYETKTALEVLLRVKDESDKWIKLNAFVIEKMLDQHSQVIALWQSVIDNSEATYGQTGKKAKSSPTAILRTKA